MPIRLDSRAADFAASFRTFLGTKREAMADVEAAARSIIADVALRGDEALIELSRRFDGVDLDQAGLKVRADEVELGSRWTAIEAVGLYVPGGTAAYPSSVLMNAVPAKVAGVPRLVMVVPA